MDKQTKLDKFLGNLIDKHLDAVAMGLLLVLAVAARLCLMPETELSPDYNTYYLDWVNSYREYGIIAGLGKSIGDYYVPYNVMYAICSLFPCEPYVPITVFSTIAEFVSAYYIFRIVKLLISKSGKENVISERGAGFIGVCTLFLPFVLFNGALWKQCDAIYVVFLVISVYHLLSENYRWAFVFLAIAFGFKLQAIFFIPMFLVVYIIKRKFSILEFLWIPFIYLLMGLPSVLCRKGIKATYLAYLSQTNEVQTEGYGMVSYYPNVYNFGLDDFSEILKVPAIALVAAMMILIAVYAYHHREAFESAENMLLLGLFMGWTCCMFLPGMHERYDYAIVLLMTALCLGIKKELIPIAIAMNVSSFLVYVIVLFRYPNLSMTVISALELTAFVYLGIKVLNTDHLTTTKSAK